MMRKVTLKEGMPKYITITLVGIIGICLLIMAFIPDEEKTITVDGTEVIEWTESRLDEEETIEYSLVDNGILDFDESLAAFVDENVKKKGVYSHLTDEHTYIMVTVGENASNEAIQLYDVRADQETLYVGHTFFKNEDSVNETKDKDISYMLIRLDLTERFVEGRIIKE